MLSEKIIEILNKDIKAKEFKGRFERELVKHEFTAEELEEKRRFMMMVCIHNNDEARELFTKTLYDDLRAQ